MRNNDNGNMLKFMCVPVEVLILLKYGSRGMYVCVIVCVHVCAGAHVCGCRCTGMCQCVKTGERPGVSFLRCSSCVLRQGLSLSQSS